MVQSNDLNDLEGNDEWAGLTSLFGLVRRYPLRIALITALATATGFGLASTRQRSFESSVYVGLNDWQNRNPVLEGLGIPSGTEDTKHAYSILRSQEVLGLVVSGADAGPEDFRMGLTTWVEEQPKAPAEKRAAENHSDVQTTLRANLDAPIGVELAIHFEDATHATVAPAASARGPWLRTLGTRLANRVLPIDLNAGPTHSVFGHTLTLDVLGDPAGRTYSLESLSKDQAIDRLRSSISLQTPDQRKQVVKASIRCTQASQAQGLASALSGAFLHHERTKAQAQAQSVVEYIHGELDLRQTELAAVDSEIADLRNLNTDLADPEEALTRLVQLQANAQEALDQATRTEQKLARILDQDRLSETSLITLRRIAENAQVDRWLDRIDELQNLTLGVQPSHSKDKAETLADRLLELQIREKTAKRYAQLFEQRFKEYKKGKTGSLEALLDDNGQDLVQTKPIIELAVRPFRQAQAKLASTREVYTDLHPDVIAAEAELNLREERLTAALSAHGATLWENHARALSSIEPLQERIESAPSDVKKQWAEGQDALWQKVQNAFEAQHSFAKSQIELRQGEWLALSQRIQNLPMDRSRLEEPLIERQALADKVHQLLAKQEDAEVALAGLRTAASVLEPASEPKLRQPHLDRLGALIGMLIGLLASLGWAQYSSQRKARREANDEHSGAQLTHDNLPVLSRMILACKDDNFAVGHPMHPNTEGPAFAALRRLRVQLNLLANRNTNTSLLGITSLVAELNEFGMEEEPSPCRLVKDPWKGSYPTHTKSLVSSTIGALGVSHAHAGKRVLLVDANVFGDSLSAHLDLVSSPGLAECLTHGNNWQDQVVTVEPSNVDVLPLGRVLGESDELMAHARWAYLLQDLQVHYDVVLVELPGVHDSPKLPQLTRLLGSVMVVENARLRIDSEESSRLLGPLRRSGTRLIGTFVALRGTRETRSKAA